MVNRIHGHHPLFHLSNSSIHRGALFRLGEVFWGKVLEHHSKAEVTIAAKGGLLKAHTTLPLVPGNRYEFFVQQEEPLLILRALDFDKSEPSRLLRLWGLHAASRASFARLLQNLVSATGTSSPGGQIELALQQLRDLLPGLICSGMDSLNAHWLAEQLSNLGLFWESKVARWLARQGPGRTAQLVAADLKGALLALQENLAQPQLGGLNQDLETAVAQTLRFVELQQQLNLLGGPELGQWFWFIPGIETQGMQSAEIFLEEPDQESGGPDRDGIIRLRLRVELSQLGPIEATMSLEQEKISCQLRVADKPLVGWISSKLPELNAALEERGFRVAFLGCEAGSVQQLPLFLLGQKGQESALLHLVV